MSKVARLVGNCYCTDDYGESYYFSVVITPQLKAKIKQLQQVAKDNDVYKVSDFNYAADIFTGGEDFVLCSDEEQPSGEEVDALIEGENTYVRLDYSLLEVSKDDFWFETVIKHTSIQVATCRMNLDEVNRAENSDEDFLNVAEW